MKKLFAIVLTVAMVLGLATTAFAAWGPSATANDPEAFPTIEVIKYVKHTAAGGSFYYTVDAGAQAINDAEVYFAVKLVVPADVKTVDDKAPIEITVKTEGLNSAVAVSKVLAEDTAALSNLGLTADADGKLTAGTYYLVEDIDSSTPVVPGFKLSTALAVNEYVNKAVCRDTDTAKVTATVSKKSTFKTENNTLTKGIWTVEHDGDTAVILYKTKPATGTAGLQNVTFTRDAQTGLVTKVEYNTTGADGTPSNGSAIVELNSEASNGYGFTLNAKDATLTTTMGPDDETFVKDALAFVGFTMADVKAKNIYMTDANCIANFGTNLKATSSQNWGAAKDPIILDAVTVIPKTGDVVTIGAAVMTLIAAAGALSLRKH